MSSWQDSRQVHHRLHQGLERPGGLERQREDEERESAEQEERPKKDEGDGALHDPEFAAARSATGTDGSGNGHPSIKPDQGDVREEGRTAGPWEPCRSRDVVITTLYLLPRSEGDRCRPSASTFPRLLAAQPALSRVSAKAPKVNINVVITKNYYHFCLLRVGCIYLKRSKHLGLHSGNLISFAFLLVRTNQTLFFAFIR